MLSIGHLRNHVWICTIAAVYIEQKWGKGGCRRAVQKMKRFQMRAEEKTEERDGCQTQTCVCILSLKKKILCGYI
jgi:hypothetical protein